jgi:hypothetical protein
VIQAILTRLAVELRATGRKSTPLVHATLRVIRTLAQAHINYLASTENVSDVTFFQSRGALDRTRASQMPNVVPNPVAASGPRSSPAALPLQQYGLTALCDPLQELLNRRDNVLPELRVKALQVCAWLGFNQASFNRAHDIVIQEFKVDSLSSEGFNGMCVVVLLLLLLLLLASSTYCDGDGVNLKLACCCWWWWWWCHRTLWCTRLVVTEVFKAFHERIKTTPNIIPFVLQLVYAWRVNLPHKFVTDTAGEIWETIINNGPEAREQVLANIFQILDLLHKPGERLHAYRIQHYLYWFLGQHGVVLAGSDTSQVWLGRRELARP